MDTIRNNKGYSLIELIVSVLVFALGFLGVTKMEQNAIMGNSFSLQMTNTLNVIDSQVEYLRGLNIDHADLSTGDHDGGTSIRNGINYSLAWTVNSTALGPDVNARNVDIVVTWTEKNMPHSVTMNLIKSNSQ
jgi:type IV pilus assembly protein PilV